MLLDTVQAKRKKISLKSEKKSPACDKKKDTLSLIKDVIGHTVIPL